MIRNTEIARAVQSALSMSAVAAAGVASLPMGFAASVYMIVDVE